MTIQLHKLEYLCIEEIGKNIVLLSRTFNKRFGQKCCVKFGDKLILSSISNSFPELDEKCLKFIFDNFYVSTFNICSNLSKKIHNFGFLNEKYLKKLEIYSTNILHVHKNNFRLSVDELKVVFDSKSSRKSRNFLSKIFATKTLIIASSTVFSPVKKNYLCVAYKILENTSKNLEYLQIKITNFLNYSPKKFKRFLTERKCLSTIKFQYSSTLLYKVVSKTQPCALKGITHYSSFIRKGWKYKHEEVILRSLLSLNHLEIDFENAENPLHSDDVKKYFSILIAYHAKKLLNLNISLPYSSELASELCKFLRNCSVLEKVSFRQCNSLSYDISLIFESLKSLKCLNFILLNYVHIITGNAKENLNNLISKSGISEIKLEKIEFKDGFFRQILMALENIKSSLTIISLSYCEFGEDGLQLLTRSLKQFSNLKEFNLFKNIFYEPELLNLFKSLQSSSKSLEKIWIGGLVLAYIKTYPVDLFDFFYKCEKLKKIRLKIRVGLYYIEEFTSILTKFSHILEEIELDFIHLSHHGHGLENFLSKCTNLVKIHGVSGLVGYDENKSKKLLKSLENCKYLLEDIPKSNIDYYDNMYIFPKIFQTNCF